MAWVQGGVEPLTLLGADHELGGDGRLVLQAGGALGLGGGGFKDGLQRRRLLTLSVLPCSSVTLGSMMSRSMGPANFLMSHQSTWPWSGPGQGAHRAVRGGREELAVGLAVNPHGLGEGGGEFELGNETTLWGRKGLRGTL